MKNICLGFMIVLIFIFCAGCGLMKSTPVVSSAADNPADGGQAARETVTREDDTSAKKIISDYFAALYTGVLADDYNEYSRTGVIPANIRGYIADKTIKEGEGNPEIGIHLPRYISINGMTIIGYDVETINTGDEEEKPNIESDFVSKNGDNYLYYTRVYCKVKSIPDEVFSKWYEKQEGNTYRKLGNINPGDMDSMRVEIRYDVELTKNDIGFSILKAVESNIKPGVKNRLFVFNNDSITRLQYLDLEKNSNGSYRNPADGETYEKEKAVITEFFSKFTELDRERMNLLSYRWKQGLKETTLFLDSLGITRGEGGAKLIQLDNNFKKDYPFNSFPLMNNMEKIKDVNNFMVTPHPAYSEKIKLYYVNFDATVQKTNGITDEHFTYRYDYIVSLAENEDSVYIDKFKLNECFSLSK